MVIAVLLPVLLSLAQAATPPKLTGAQFPNLSDLPNLKALGYDFAVISLNPQTPAVWKPALDAAEAAGIKLIVGAYPPPYSFDNASWTITNQGMAFLSYLQTRSNLVLALYVFNEPYSSNPFTGTYDACGHFSASDLRTLRNAIQSYWSGLKIYHDLGAPADWVPGSDYANATPCVGAKYSDQTGIADYVGIWHYPFTSGGYDRNNGLNVLTRNANFVTNYMQPAVPISLNQAYSCSACPPGLVMPTPQQLLDWNCATRALPLGGVEWYPWRKFAGYQQALAEIPARWPLTTAGACNPRIGADVVALSSASGAPFVAPDSMASVYGANLAFSEQFAQSLSLPTTLGGVSVQVQDASGAIQPAKLSYVAPGQINFVMPSGMSPGQAGLTLATGAGAPLLGTALIGRVAPALFSADGSGSGAALGAALRIASDLTSTVIATYQCTGPACAAAPIDLTGNSAVYLVLYGTGIRNQSSAVSCFIRGVSVPVAFAGPQGQYAGLDQLNLGPLTNFTGSGEFDLACIADGVTSNTVRVAFR